MRCRTDMERPVRIKRKIRKRRYLSGKRVYKRERIGLTIPARYKEVIEPFLNKDLEVDVRREGNSIIIDVKPMENTR
jgi:hypothetical protein